MQRWHGAASLVDAMELLAKDKKEEEADRRYDEDGNESAEDGGGRVGRLVRPTAVVAGVGHRADTC